MRTGYKMARVPKRDWRTSDKPTDELLENLLNQVQKKRATDNDVLILSVGETGSGKSMLNLHIGNILGGDNFSIDCISLDPETFANTLHHVKSLTGIRVLLNDEANINKRASMSTYNRDTLNVYMSIRGLNIIHLWCNPSLDLIDKAFVKERLNGVILVLNTGGINTRVYYYFSKNAILQILMKYNNLELATLRKVRKKYAIFRGWFKDYKGNLKEEYNNKKQLRMNNVVDNFFEKYGSKGNNVDLIKLTTIGKNLNITETTVKKWLVKMHESGLLKEEEDFIINGLNRYMAKPEGALKIEEYIINFHRGKNYGRIKTD